ncbi:hypothetical protein L484_013718 [Morus notabilis]|uniref:Amino acid transporter transmembrane domain-containing protein n=1 Tax=Morus notabilis TaxID=981085 RepID=W9QLJ7_9ROSA|nr:amino acid transporter AVT3C [Morus notabilis]EXB40415.1 hypothetical protein L484_013718 [Morus notabilis]
MGFGRDRASSSSNELRDPPPPPEREDTALIGDGKHLSSQPKTFANLFIAIVGAGVLGLPYTFKRTGWLTTLLMVFAIAALTHYCMMLLIHTRRRLETLTGFSKIASFGDLGFAVCGSFGRILVDVLIILAQAGFCVGYLVFIGKTMADLLNSSKSFYILGCLPFQLGLNSIKTLTHLAPLSIFADVVDLGAMSVVMVQEALVVVRNGAVVRAFGGFSEFFYGLGVAVYAFEGIGMALPLESEMRDKKKFGKVLAFTMVFLSLIYVGFGILGYLAYGDETQDIITANLGPGVVSTLVKLGLSVNLFFTLPLMMNPVYEIVERRFWGGTYCLWLRWLWVLIVILVALFVPNFGDFLSLVGSGVCCALGFVLPSLFHFLVFKDEMGKVAWFSDVTIFVVGIFLGVSGTWYALQEMFAVKV